VTRQERSALLRMAGNIAGGLAANPEVFAGNVRGRTTISSTTLAAIQHDAVTIALGIFEDERLKVDDEPISDWVNENLLGKRVAKSSGSE
jgi:hypothetical protein